MIPGDTAFTRTGASSSARLRASDSRAPFAAPTIAEFGRARDAPSAPEFAFHGRAHVFHGNGFERAGAKLRGGDHDMVDRMKRRVIELDQGRIVRDERAARYRTEQFDQVPRPIEGS